MSNGVTEYTVPTSNSSPSGIAVGPDNLLWFTEFMAAKLAKVTTTGVFSEYALGTGHFLPSIISGPGGKLWFTDVVTSLPSPGYYVGNCTTAGSITEYQATTSGAPNINGLALGADGNIWAADASGNYIVKVTPSGAITLYTVPTASSTPADICAGPDGALWFTETTGNKIGRITTGGVFTEYPLPNANSQPGSICAGPDGALWFTEINGNRIGRITTAGAISEWTVPTSASSPRAIAVGPDGALWFLEGSASKVGRITPSGTITEVATLAFNSSPMDLVTGPDNLLWFTETSTNKIAKLGWIPNSYPRSNDPVQCLLTNFGADSVAPNTGNLTVRHAVDLAQSTPAGTGSGGSCGCGCGTGSLNDSTLQLMDALVYNADRVNVTPIIESTLASDAAGSVPSSIKAQLTWNGTAQATVTYATTGHSAGDVYDLTVQAGSTVATSTAVPWQLELWADFTGGDVITRTYSGTDRVPVATSANGFGYGWTLQSLDQLTENEKGTQLEKTLCVFESCPPGPPWPD